VNRALIQASGFLSSHVAARLKVRYAPKFEFYYDLQEGDKEFEIKLAEGQGRDTEAEYKELNETLKKLGAKQDPNEDDDEDEDWIFRSYKVYDNEKEFRSPPKISPNELQRRKQQAQSQTKMNERKKKKQLQKK
jgi:hypothetical protein